MKLSRTTLVLPLAGLLVIAGAGAVLATSSGAAQPATGGVIPAVESPSPDGGTPAIPTPARDTALTDVLDKLVAEGTITETQKTAILDALTAERTARRTERQAERDQLRTFLEDGVITRQEFDQLPADSPLRQLEDLLGNGGITSEELRALGHGFGMGKGFGPGNGFGPGRGHMFGPGHMFGNGGPGPDLAPDASPDASPSTSS